jgi:hypothetical protein
MNNMSDLIEVSGTERKVCHDIAARQRVGVKKYGVSVEANLLDHHGWLQHAYEECLDMAVYLRRAMDGMEKNSITIELDTDAKTARVCEVGE